MGKWVNMSEANSILGKALESCKDEVSPSFYRGARLMLYKINEMAEEVADTPQTESTGSPIGDYRDGVGAWQTDCDDRYAIRTDSGEVVAHACPLGCEQMDCPWK